MRFRLCETTLTLLVMASLVSFAKAASNSSSFPPDSGPHSRPITQDDLNLLEQNRRRAVPARPAAAVLINADVVVNNTNPNLRNTDTLGGSEPGIAVDPLHNNRIVITAFSGNWGVPSPNAPLWLSNDGGMTWTKEFTVNPPPGVPGVRGPADQTVDFMRFGALAGTFLAFEPPPPARHLDIFSALSGNLTAPSFDYFKVGGVAQATNHLGGVNNVDQPWLLVGPRPGWSIRESVYVAYDNFATNPPEVRVAAAWGINPLKFTTDNRSGFSGGNVNPGHRLAIDPRSGAVYSLFQESPGPGAGIPPSQNINYKLNRSTDGGSTWALNGSLTGVVVANADSDQFFNAFEPGGSSFCRVNQLRGGADHAAVDPQTGDVVYVYGARDPDIGNNRLAMRRLTPNAAGGLTIGPQIFITGQVQATIPSVAITANRTIGVFYYTCDNPALVNPQLSAHFATSTNGGATFTDAVLSTFLSPQTPDANPNDTQRVLGDFVQVKALGNEFFGTYTGNGVNFGRPVPISDPIFYRVSAQ